ncbi:MAG: HAMP domain-containing histidine kinase [bacterium]|nr:HAMP domain-containing histidine kinase [bacterium]
MSLRRVVVPVLVMLSAATVLMIAVNHQLSSAWFGLGVHPEVVGLLERSMEDQKELAAVLPDSDDLRRERFDEIRSAVNHIHIVEHSRDRILLRYELVLFSVLAFVVVAGTLAAIVGGRRDARRLSSLQHALEQLSTGSADLTVGVGGRDSIGQVARMVETTSRMVGRQRQRLAAMQALERWQEAARRIGHEINGPLNAAQLELGRLEQLLTVDSASEIHTCVGNVTAELRRLGRWTRSFGSFARLPEPRPEIDDVAELVDRFCTVFGQAWSEITIEMKLAKPAPAAIDTDLMHHLLTNLADNAARAMDGRGTLSLDVEARDQWITIDITDTGPGIPEHLQGQLFQPYFTGRPIGEGTGLGLAIARKVALDHGGDLRLFESSDAGSTFRLTIPAASDPGDVQ